MQSAWVEQVRRFNAAKLAGPVPISVAQFHDSTNASTIIISHCRFQSHDSTNASTIIISNCRFQSHDSTNASTIIISHADFSRTIPRFYKCFKRINICHCPLQSRDSTNASTIIISDCRIQSHDSTILQTIVIISLSLSLSLPISEAPFQDSTTASMIIILKHGGNKECGIPPKVPFSK